MYLFSEFFESKPVEHLLGKGIQASHLNDSRLGRVLDQLYAEGTSSFFLRVALQAAERFEVSSQQVHLDSSSFSLQGQYQEPESGDLDATAIRICRGYSKDKRPDLKQFVLNLLCSADGGIPLWLKVSDGNQSDVKQFAKLMKQFGENWDMERLFVIDAAFFSESNLQTVSALHWLSRVPKTLKAAQTLIQSDTNELSPVACERQDYLMWQTQSEYAGVQQRWLLIESQTRKADQAFWEPELKKLEKRVNRELKALHKQVFASKPDALEALMAFQDTLAQHQLTGISVENIYPKRTPGRPAKSKSKDIVGYRLSAKLERKSTAEEYYQHQGSRFILATNQLDAQQLPAEQMLREYQGQQKVERGFRFLKDPLFFASSLFVKKPQRLEALALVMALTLMVYTLAERRMRQTLAAQQQTVLDQKKKPTAKPTFRWILQKFQGIHLVQVDQLKKHITNLTDERRRIICLLGRYVEPYYSTT